MTESLTLYVTYPGQSLAIERDVEFLMNQKTIKPQKLYDIICEHPEYFHYLPKQGPHNALMKVSAAGNYEFAEFILMNGGNPNTLSMPHKMNALTLAVFNNHIEIVELLLKYGANPNIKDKDEWTPLFHAVSYSHIDFAKLLIEYGANPKARDRWGDGILTANKYGPSYAIKKYISSVVQNNNFEDNLKFITETIKDNKMDKLEEWLEENNIHIGDADGNSLLHLAVELENEEMIEMIIDYGVHINRQNFIGQTALHIAATKNNFKIVKFLVEAEALTFIRDNNSETATELTSSDEIRAYLNEKNSVPILRKELPKPNWYMLVELISHNFLRPENEILELLLQCDLTHQTPKEAINYLNENTQNNSNCATVLKALTVLNVIESPNTVHFTEDIKGATFEEEVNLLYLFRNESEKALSKLEKITSSLTINNYSNLFILIVADLLRLINKEPKYRLDLLLVLEDLNSSAVKLSLEIEGYNISHLLDLDNPLRDLGVLYQDIMININGLLNEKKILKMGRSVNFITLNLLRGKQNNIFVSNTDMKRMITREDILNRLEPYYKSYSERQL